MQNSLLTISFHSVVGMLFILAHFRMAVLYLHSVFASPDCVDEAVALDCVVLQGMPDSDEQFASMFLIIFFIYLSFGL